MVGKDQVKPVEAKVEAISDFPVPSGKRQLSVWLDITGNSVITSLPLQSLCQTYLAKGSS